MLGLMNALRERLAIGKQYGHASSYGDNNPSFDVLEPALNLYAETVKNKAEQLMFLTLPPRNAVCGMYMQIDFDKALRKANEYLGQYGLPEDYYQAFSVSNIGAISTNKILPNEPAFVLFYLYYCVNLTRYLITSISSNKSEFRHYELDLSYIGQHKTPEELRETLPSTLGGWISYVKSNGQSETYQEQGFRPMVGSASVDWNLDTWGEYVDFISVRYTELQKVYFSLDHPITFVIRPYDDRDGGFLGFNGMDAGRSYELKLTGNMPVDNILWDSGKEFGYGRDGFDEGKWTIQSSFLDIFDLSDLEFKDESAFDD